SDRQPASAASRDCTMASSPYGGVSMRAGASTRVSFGRRNFRKPAPAPDVGGGWGGAQKAAKRRPTGGAAGGIFAVTIPSALVKKNRRPAAAAQGGKTRVRVIGG